MRILEGIRISDEWTEELVESFSKLFNQEGRFLNVHQFIHPESTLLSESITPLFVTEWTDTNPDSDLDSPPMMIDWGESSPSTPSTPLDHYEDWLTYLNNRRGRILFDFKGNGGMRSLGRRANYW